MTAELHQLRFASDATLAALSGGALFVLAGLAMWADVRRTRRKNPDSVGWVPWLPIFFLSAVLGVGLLVMAIKGWGTK